ncbi:MAG: DsbA family protein [Bdellovibrionales bacterium]|nr:DsbA family protein [Bdellovibrionales bacterium]
MKKSGMKYLSYTLATSMMTVAIFVVITACGDRQAKAKPNIVTKTAPQAGVVAKIGGQLITEAELIGEDKMDFFELKKREYELRMERINRLIVERLIGEEAKKANMSLDDYIDKKVSKGDAKISDADIKKFAADKKIPDSQMNDQIKERIKSYMQMERRRNDVNAYISKLTKGSPVEIYFERPKMDVKVELAEHTPTLGKKGAKVTIVEFSDFQCPFCARGAETVHQIAKKYGSKVAIGFRHFPLPMHKEARPASEASMCVNEQGSDKFWKFHDKIFQNQQNLDDANLEKMAKESGANVEKFKACYSSKKYAKVVQDDMEYGEKVGVRSTPTFFVNGQIVNGAVPIEQFSEIIDEELAAN